MEDLDGFNPLALDYYGVSEVHASEWCLVTVANSLGFFQDKYIFPVDAVKGQQVFQIGHTVYKWNGE